MICVFIFYFTFLLAAMYCKLIFCMLYTNCVFEINYFIIIILLAKADVDYPLGICVAPVAYTRLQLK